MISLKGTFSFPLLFKMMFLQLIISQRKQLEKFETQHKGLYLTLSFNISSNKSSLLFCCLHINSTKKVCRGRKKPIKILRKIHYFFFTSSVLNYSTDSTTFSPFCINCELKLALICSFYVGSFFTKN